MSKVYKRCEFEEIVNRISEGVNYYDKVFPKDNRYILYLANGDRICYTFDENKIAHLLGLNLDYLVESSIYRRTTTKDLLDKFLENSYSIYNKLNTYGSINTLLSNYVEDKIAVFREQLKNPYPDNIYFVCKYDRTITYTSSEIDVYTADYYIARKLENDDIILLGLVKNKNNNIYSVQTSRVIKKDSNQMEELTKFLQGQEITYVNSLEIENYQTMYKKDYHLSIEEKKEVIKNMIDISNCTNSKPNTIKNHLFDIICVSNSKSKLFNQKLILSQLIDSIDKKNIYDLSESNIDSEILESIDSEIKTLIKKWNDLVCNSNFTNYEVKHSYTELQDEKDELEKQNKTYEERIKEIEEENKKLREEKKMLETYKVAYEDFSSKIFTLTKEEQKREFK